MLPETQSAERIAFGSFELETATGELFTKGIRVRLSGQPIDVLVILVRNPGKLVSREELRLALWPEDTFVDFDRGLNNCIRRIRDALEDSPESPRFIETLPKKGYRFIADTRTVPATEIHNASSAGANPPLPPSQQSVPPPDLQAPDRLKGIRWNVLISALLILVVSFLLFLGWRIRNSRTTSVTVHAIAVLPLANLSGDSSQDYLSDGVTDELITELAQETGVPVISRTSSMLYKNKQKSMPQIAHELGVDAVVEGTLHRTDDNLRMTLHLVDGATDKSIWAQSYDGAMTNVRELEIRVAGDLADHIRTPRPLRVQTDSPKPIAPEAYDEFLKGQYLWQRDNSASLRHFERAAAIQPDYAAAYGGIAKANVVLSGTMPPDVGFSLIIKAADKALSLDACNPDAHAATAYVLRTRDWNFQASEAESLRAIACHPNDSYVYRFYSIMLMNHGQMADAFKQARLALRLDPANYINAAHYAHLLELSGDLKGAIEQYQASVELNPNGYWLNLAEVLQKNGQLDRAAEALQRGYIVRGEPDIASEFKRQYTVSGYTKAAAAAQRVYSLRQLQKLEDKRAKKEYVSSSAYVVYYAGLQDREETLRWLDRAYREHSQAIFTLKMDMFDFLRNDPRFDKLYRSIPF
jgi:TolB-like protein/DNA-binding winged helix-turn-helix (wHTH) protein/tetratricopeptide (TPR) repeat protein